MDRAYSLLTVKAFDDAERIIEGIASTPDVDRAGDVLVPRGAEFRLPLTFLWQHDKAQPIGDVIAATVTDDGIHIRARVARVDEPGSLRDRLENAWQTLKAGLVKGLSIGFIPKRYGPIKGSDGKRIDRWAWLELSAVTIPANQSASITAIKAACVEPPASGRRVVAIISDPASRASKQGTRCNDMTFKEQIAAFENTRAAKAARQSELMTKAADKGETLDAAAATEFDGLAEEIKDIDAHLIRLRATDEANARAAKPVAGTSPDAAAAARTPPTESHVVRVTDNVPPGMDFTRAFICRAVAFLSNGGASAIEIAKARYPDASRLHIALKAPNPVGAGTTTDPAFAAPLAYAQDFAAGFVDFLRPQTLIGRVPGLFPVPFNIRVGQQTTGGTSQWVGQGKAKPLTAFQFTQQTLGITKLAAITVLADELVRVSSPSAELLVRKALAECVQQQMDHDFVDPANAGTANVKPASITNGVAPIATSGTDYAAVIKDLLALINPIAVGLLDPSDVVLIMPSTVALALSALINPLGQSAFSGMSAKGGTLGGYPVVTSQIVSGLGANGDVVIAVHAPSIYVADEGGVSVDASREASLEMSDAPTADGTTGVGAAMVSMWQNNLLAIRAERTINWKKVRPAAVQWMANVAWGKPAAALADAPTRHRG